MPNLFIASGIFHPESGGPATYLREILPHLQERDWDVRLLTFADHGAAGGDYPYPVTRIPRTHLLTRMSAYAMTARPLLAWADVTYIHSLGLPLIGGKAPRVAKIVGDPAWERAIRKGWTAPTTDVDAFQTAQYRLPVQIDKAKRAREAAHLDAIIVPSEYLKRMVVGWGADSSHVHVIYNAMPPAPRTALPPLAEARQRLGLLPDVPTLLTVGRILPWKGVDHVIRAVARLPDVHLIVAGDGGELDSLRRLAQSLKAADRVTFTGNIDRAQVDMYMRAADYTALYSGYEGLSHTLLESLRAGTPCIASDKGGNPEVIRHDENGLLVPYIDADALTETIRDAFAPGKRDQLAANAHMGMERFDFTRMVDATHRVLTRFG
ncbi:MAG: glycosyltransferase family 4 protein [bacterium]|nr:glycosyltransferase family 4 protein [bacterium]